MYVLSKEVGTVRYGGRLGEGQTSGETLLTFLLANTGKLKRQATLQLNGK